MTENIFGSFLSPGGLTEKDSMRAPTKRVDLTDKLKSHALMTRNELTEKLLCTVRANDTRQFDGKNWYWWRKDNSPSAQKDLRRKCRKNAKSNIVVYFLWFTLFLSRHKVQVCRPGSGEEAKSSERRRQILASLLQVIFLVSKLEEVGEVDTPSVK